MFKIIIFVSLISVFNYNNIIAENQKPVVNDSTIKIIPKLNKNIKSQKEISSDSPTDSINIILQSELQKSTDLITNKFDSLISIAKNNYIQISQLNNRINRDSNKFDWNLLIGLSAIILAIFSIIVAAKTFILSTKLSQGKLKPLLQFIPQKITHINGKKLKIILSLYNYSPNDAKNIVIDFDFGAGWIVEYLRAHDKNNPNTNDINVDTYSLSDYPKELIIKSLKAGIIRDDITFVGDFDWKNLENEKSKIIKVRSIWEGYSYKLMWNLYWKKTNDLVRYEKVQAYTLYFIEGKKKAYSLIPAENAIYSE